MTSSRGFKEKSMPPAAPKPNRPPVPPHLRHVVRRAPLETSPEVSGERFLFLGGLHRSGTSILHRLLRAHPEVSGFAETGVPQDEGQLLQSVYPPAWVYGGPGRFAFHAEAHLTETSDLVSPVNRAQLLREWGAYHDLGRRVLMEKSPPNLIWSRFLQALFPGARFVFIVRHPIPVALATLRWAKTSVPELLAHWTAAHRILLDDLARIDHAKVLRYEDFVADPARRLGALCRFAGLSPIAPAESVADHNARYLALWQEKRDAAAEAERRLASADREAAALFARFGYGLSEPYVAPWQAAGPYDLMAGSR